MKLHLPETKRGRFLAAFLVVVAGITWTLTYGPLRSRKPTESFTVGKETTYVTGPVDKDGYIDYVTALNQRLSEGITPAENANVLLWQAFGPHPEGGTMPPGYFHWLGMKRPPEKGDYWIEMNRFLKEHPKLAPRKAKHPSSGMYPANEDLTKATRGPWKATEFRWIAAWLQANAKPLGMAIQATHRRRYFNPLIPARRGDARGSLVDSLLPNIQKCRELANGIICRAMLALGEARIKDAWHDVLACHRLARLVARGGTLVELLVGFAIDHAAGEADLAILEHGRLDAAQIIADLHDLQGLLPFPAVADKIDVGERLFFLDSSISIMRGDVSYFEALSGEDVPRKPSSFIERVERWFSRWRVNQVHWESFLLRANRWFDQLVAALRIPDHAVREKALTNLMGQLQAAKAAAMARGFSHLFLPTKDDGKVMCDVLMSLFVPATSKIQQASDRTEQLESNLYVAFALAAYRQDYGRYPDNLSSLALKYLAQVPSDLFSGKPLVYRPRADGYLLYSVGINGKDDGGRGYEDVPRGDDLTVRMPPAPPG